MTFFIPHICRRFLTFHHHCNGIFPHWSSPSSTILLYLESNTHQHITQTADVSSINYYCEPFFLWIYLKYTYNKRLCLNHVWINFLTTGLVKFGIILIVICTFGLPINDRDLHFLYICERTDLKGFWCFRTPDSSISERPGTHFKWNLL